MVDLAADLVLDHIPVFFRRVLCHEPGEFARVGEQVRPRPSG